MSLFFNTLGLVLLICYSLWTMFMCIFVVTEKLVTELARLEDFESDKILCYLFLLGGIPVITFYWIFQLIKFSLRTFKQFLSTL